ncbi:MAG: hypothetical protein EOP67_74535, partial [Sphingomonas sp.]
MKKTLSLAAALPVALPAALFALAGCSQDRTVYPSLGARPVEKLGFGEPEVKVAVATPDPALDADIATLSKQLATITTGFDKDSRVTEAAARAARGGAVGSE